MQIFDIIKEIKTFPRLVRRNGKSDRIRKRIIINSKQKQQEIVLQKIILLKKSRKLKIKIIKKGINRG